MAVLVGDRIAPVLAETARRDTDADRRLAPLVFADTQQMNDALDVLATVAASLDRDVLLITDGRFSGVFCVFLLLGAWLRITCIFIFIFIMYYIVYNRGITWDNGWTRVV